MVKYGVRLGWTAAIVLLACASAFPASSVDAGTDQLKARIASAPVGERPKLCVEVAQKQLEAADKLYAADDVENAQTTLSDVTAYSELARDYAIQSHKYEKQTEIAVRAMTRKLNNILHTLGRDEEAPVQEALKRLERVRDDLLTAMFPKGSK